MYRLMFAALACLPAAVLAAAPAPAAELQAVLVTAERPALQPPESFRTVVIGRDEIERLPARSVEELLVGVAGVDLRQRGPGGVQADLGIRGGTFEQTLVLIDGVKVSDPQTGHHNLDLPVTLDDIERIEVLKGPAARAWGPNAFAGVVNIVTRRPAGRSARIRASDGSHATRTSALSLSGDAGALAGRLSVDVSDTAGFRPNTDAELGTVSLSGAATVGPARLRLTSGYAEKEFGANGFYSNLFPNQREETKTGYVSLAGDAGSGWLKVAPKLFWRRHKDHYRLDFQRPGFFENRHETDVGGAEVETTLETGAGVTVIGGELARERIESTSLGDHTRRRGGIFLNHRIGLGARVSVGAGAFAAYHSDWGWEAWPGADLGVALGGGVRLFASADKSFRVPTFTELYYTSPANMGNPALRPEEAWTYETGVEWRVGGHRLALSAFRREGRNLIDWVRSAPTEPWQVRNRTDVRTDGLDAGWEWRAARAQEGAEPFLRRLRAGWTWLDSQREAAGLESKYVLDHLRHQVVLEAEHALGLGLSQSWRLVWAERLGGEDHFTADTRVRRPFGRGEVFVEAANLFNARYSDIGGIPAPGRWVTAGVQLDLGPW